MRFDWNSLDRVDWVALEAIGTISVAFLTLLTIIITLVALSLSRRQAREQARALEIGSIQSISRELMKLTTWLADNPTHRDALLLPETTETTAGETAAAVYLTFVELVFTQISMLPAQNVASWQSYFQDQFDTYPQLSKYLRTHAGWYSAFLGQFASIHEPFDTDLPKSVS